MSSRLPDFVDEIAKRHAIDEVLMAGLHEKQREFVSDPSRRKAALCPRRSGKTVACIVEILRTMLLEPGSQVLYLCITRGQAEKNIMATLREYDHKFGINGAFTGGGSQEITYTMPWGSKLWVRGGETLRELEKARGQWYSKIIIDEGKSFKPATLEEGLKEILEPTLSDRLGSMVFIGTPGTVLAGPFYEITTTAPGWSRHSWTVSDNTAMPHIWDECLRLKKERIWDNNHPVWRREYLGQWCPAEDQMVVHAYDSQTCTYEDIPEGVSWVYTVGLYAGFGDSWGIAVTAHSDNFPTAYVVHSEVLEKAPLSTLSGRLSDVVLAYGAEIICANLDRFRDSYVNKITELYDLGVSVADTRQRYDMLEILNNALHERHLLVKKDSRLADEWVNLQWADDKRKLYADGCDYQATEACLYAVNYLTNHLYKPEDRSPPPGSPEWAEEQERLAEERAANPSDASDWGVVMTDFEEDYTW